MNRIRRDQTRRFLARIATLSGSALLLALAVSAPAQERPSARDALKRMTAAAEAAIPYSVEFEQKGVLGALKCTAYQQRSSAGHYQNRVDTSGALPGREFRITSWENEAGLWQQYGASVLRLDFAPRSKQSPLMAFAGALTEDNYDEARLEKEITFQGTRCYVIRARLSRQISEAGPGSSASRPVEQVYTISKSDWLPRSLETLDRRGNKIGSLVYSVIRTRLSLDQTFMLPPATNVAVLKSAREMTPYVQAYSHAFVPAAREVLSVKARTGKRIGILLSAFVVFTGVFIAWRIRRSRTALGVHT